MRSDIASLWTAAIIWENEIGNTLDKMAAHYEKIIRDFILGI